MAFAFSSLLVQLPLLVVLIAGFVLISSRRARLGARSTTLAMIGLALLTGELILSMIWTISFPQLIASLDLQPSGFGLISAAVSLILTSLTAVGLSLLIAALVSRPAADPATPLADPYPRQPPPYPGH
ncbi:hypothetical protein [Actinoplanes sp. NPDC049265]|uniref:hypothetical protein n=1 Tax=Actinoplanes sp. NPDC049265 TaxID=3363902 RepID=UPI003717A036